MPLTARVSILERLVPALAFALVAFSGAVGAAMVIRFLTILSKEENAGYAAFFGATAEVEFAVGVVLVLGAALGAIGIVVSAIRLFTTNTTSSPPGLLFLLTGLLGLVPPLAFVYILRLMKGVLLPEPTGGGVADIRDTVFTVSYIAIGSAVLIALVMLAFSFIPFSSRTGRKATPLISLLVIETIIIALTAIVFWEARTSIVERDRDRDSSYLERNRDHISGPTPPGPPFDNPGTNSNEANVDNPFRGVVNTNSKALPRTISGGVLNGKAISLPKPPYPAAARSVNAAGSVSVQVLVDEKGEVVSANAVSGHPLLRPAAVQAARAARFTVTKLSGQPVKVSGVLTYNFSPQ